MVDIQHDAGEIAVVSLRQQEFRLQPLKEGPSIQTTGQGPWWPVAPVPDSAADLSWDNSVNIP
jgi:hypothetical protein